MNKNLYFKNFGKLFLIMGAVFAVTEIGQASAQLIPITCLALTAPPNHKHSTTSGIHNSPDYSNWRICSKWAVDINALMPHIIARLPAQASANTIINNASPSTFKAKIISSIPNGDQQFKAKMLSAIPDADQQFKAKVMTLLPLPELAKYYDPNRIFE